MDTMMTTSEILNNGMNYLVEKLGAVGAERFISIIIREKFDYTKWQQEYFDNMSKEELNNSINEFLKNHKHTGQAKTII